jgi:chromosome segregation ATPase
MTDFPSDFEQEARRQERAVDDHRRRQELEAEVARLKDELETANNDRTAMVEAINNLHARRSNLQTEVVRLAADLAWYRGRAHRAEYIVVRLAVTLSRYSGFDPGALIEAHAPENAGPPSTTPGG